MSRTSITLRLTATAVAALLLVAVVVLFATAGSFRRTSIQGLEEKAATLTAFADATKDYLSEMHEREVFATERLADELGEQMAKGQGYQRTGAYKTIPIVAGWTTAERTAQEMGLDFRIVAFDPRNEDNDPRSDAEAAEFRADMLRDLESQRKLTGEGVLARIDERHHRLHLMRAITLEKSCMVCHGDPATSRSGDGLDPTGFRMEGWREGQTHGAYEVVMPLAAVDAAVASFTWEVAVWVFVVAAIACGVFWWLLQRLLKRPLAELTQRLGEVASGDGDLTRRLVIGRRDEIGAAAEQFNRFASKIHDTIVEVGDMCASVEQSTGTVVGETQSMAQRATADAATIEEINATLEEISAISTETAQSCSEACEGAQRTKAATNRGNEEVTRLTAAMDAIRESSRTVTGIVEVIQEVSFQTNLLALNAAVEAARAGEAGRGFAVVAEEVRRLASRSASAATETSQLVEEARRRAEHGAAIASDFRGVLQQVDQEATQVESLLVDVAEAVGKQSRNVTLVAGGVANLSQTTQDNAMIAEQVAQASLDGAQQVARLRQVVGGFRVDGDLVGS
ncbi:MAG: methyl-accepting chemotaxis protein [Planctomycetota bacterium]